MALFKNATKEQIMEEINSLDRNKTSIVADIKDITTWDISDGKFNVTLEGTQYHFREHAKTQFLKKLRIPKNYFDSCSEDLRNQELAEGIANLSLGTENRFKVWINPETNEPNVYGIIPIKCRDFLSGEIVEQVLGGMGSQAGVTITEFYSELEQLRIRFVNSENSYTKVDEEYPVVDFKFSEVLKTPIALQSGLYRKVCSNGLMVPQEINQSFVMPLPRFKQDVFDIQIKYVDNAASGLAAIAKTLEELKQIELPRAVIEDDPDNKTLFDQVFEYVLPKPVRTDYGKVIKAEFNSEENFTVNGVVNAATKIARDLTVNDDKVLIETAAGMFVSKVALRTEFLIEKGEQVNYTPELLESVFKKKKVLRSSEPLTI